jgi:hypothetical protein
MATEPENTTEETVAGNGAGGDVSLAAVDPSANGAGAQPAAEATKPGDETAKAEAEAIDASLNADVLARFDKLFADDKEAGNAVSGALLTDEMLKTLPAPARQAIRAVAAERDKAQAALKAEQDAWAAKQAEEQKKLDDGAKELNRRRIELQKLVNTDTLRNAVAKPPAVDPTTPEGMRAIAEYEAKKGLAEALRPFAEDKARAERETAYDRLKDEYPELKDPKVEEQFAAFLRKENEGIDPTKQAPRVNAVLGARLFTSELRAKTAAETARAARDAAAADRAPAASLLNRRTSGATAQPLRDIPKDIWQAGGADLTNYLQSLTPDQRAELRRNMTRASA